MGACFFFFCVCEKKITFLFFFFKKKYKNTLNRLEIGTSFISKNAWREMLNVLGSANQLKAFRLYGINLIEDAELAKILSSSSSSKQIITNNNNNRDWNPFVQQAICVFYLLFSSKQFF